MNKAEFGRNAACASPPVRIPGGGATKVFLFQACIGCVRIVGRRHRSCVEAKTLVPVTFAATSVSANSCLASAFKGKTLFSSVFALKAGVRLNTSGRVG